MKHTERLSSTEIIFDPSLIIDHNCPPGIAQMAQKSILSCDSDLMINMYNNIVLTGGSTMMPGFKERFENEIIRIAEQTAKTDINVFADLHRKNAAWIGGSMLASFSTFKDMCITKEEYDNTVEIEKPQAILKKTIN